MKPSQSNLTGILTRRGNLGAERNRRDGSCPEERPFGNTGRRPSARQGERSQEELLPAQVLGLFNHQKLIRGQR